MLSEREKEILSLAGLSNKQIAKRLNISWKTVQRCFSNMYAKTGCKNRTDLYSQYSNRLTDAEIIELIRAYAKLKAENEQLLGHIEFLRNKLNERMKDVKHR